jgi:hypothetical protein
MKMAARRKGDNRKLTGEHTQWKLFFWTEATVIRNKMSEGGVQDAGF